MEVAEKSEDDQSSEGQSEEGDKPSENDLVGCMRNFGHSLDDFFTYTHKKKEKAKKQNILSSRPLGLLYRLIQLTILVYTFGYELWFSHGYQEFSGINSFVMTEVNGVVHANMTDDQLKLTSLGKKNQHQQQENLNSFKKIADDTDYVIPAEEMESFFVITNGAATNQTRGSCAEGASVKGAQCASLDDQTTCEKGLDSENGIMTGKCVDSPFVPGTFVCEIYGWCPVPENTKARPILLPDAENATVLLINNAYFDFNRKTPYRTQNIKKKSGECEYLGDCLYDPSTSRFCPVFRLGDIVRHAGQNYSEMSKEGGIVLITIIWDCNLDWGANIHDCAPSYGFTALEDDYEDCEMGYHVVYAHYVTDTSRTLFNATGIYYIVQVDGSAREFNFKLFVIKSLAAKTAFDLTSVVFKYIMSFYDWLRNKCRRCSSKSNCGSSANNKRIKDLPDGNGFKAESTNKCADSIRKRSSNGKCLPKTTSLKNGNVSSITDKVSRSEDATIDMNKECH